MSATAAPHVVVAGGSLGGLSAALWLQDVGCETDVYERSQTPLEGQGAGIVLNPATVRWIVEREGVDLERIGIAARYVRYLGPAGDTATELVAPYRFSSYDTLYGTLLSAYGRDRYHLGQTVVSASQDDRRVQVTFASGEQRQCEMLVWADGIRSSGRRHVAPEAERRYAGYIAWRGTVDRSALSTGTRKALDDAITYTLMPHSHMLTYPIPAREEPVINWLWYRNVEAGDELNALMTDVNGTRREVSVPPGAVGDRQLSDLKDASERLLPWPLVELVSNTAQPFLQAIFDIDVPRMVVGRTCLIGDAAVALRPHAAAGSAKAVEDGYRLGLAMRETSHDVLAALAVWEPRQLALARGVLARTREAGDRSQFHGTWRVGDPIPFGLYEVGDSIMGS